MIKKDWKNNFEKVNKLKKINKNLIFNKKASNKDIKNFEEKTGIILPNQLKEFYTEIFNGGISPFGEIDSLEVLSKNFLKDLNEDEIEFEYCNLKPNEKYEVEYNLNNKSKKIINSDFIVKEYPYTNGFIPLVYDGCTFHYGIISEGLKINKVVESNSFVVVYESEKDFIEIYSLWLDYCIKHKKIVMGLDFINNQN